MSKKYSYEFVKKCFEDRSYILVSKEYKRVGDKLEIICPVGHETTIVFKTFLAGADCKECYYERVGNKKRLNYSFVKKCFEDRGYTLLTKKYKSVDQKLDVICPKGHSWSTSLHNFKDSTNRCFHCVNAEKNVNRKYTYSEVKVIFKEGGYRLLSTQYKNNKENLDVMCDRGHNIVTSLHNFQSGGRCPICFNDRRGNSRRLDKNYIIEYVESFNYDVLEIDYKNIYSMMKLKCPKGHIYSVRYNNFQQGNRCPMCPNKISKAELEIYKIVKSYFPDTISGDRKILNGLELDVYVPSKKIAFEYCGLFWHSEQQGRQRNYHINKLDKCKSQGIDLITIFEDEYINRPDVVISRIKNKLGVSNAERIFARKCKIKEIDAKIKNVFLNKFHLQGGDRSNIKLGAFYKDKLVSVMTFSKPSIAKGLKNTKDTYELNRFCSDSSCTVIGIASKLFKYFIRNYEFKYCFSFGDKRWSNGNVYKKLGFEFEYDTKPNYWYIVDGQRKHRYNYRKSELSKKLETFNPKLTEYQNMTESGIDRIWDCGSTKWIFKNGDAQNEM